MNKINYNQVLTIAMYEFKNSCKSFSYFTLLFIPLIVFSSLDHYVNIHHFSSKIIALYSPKIFAVSIPIVIFAISVMYMSTLANLISRDKSSKLSEMLLSFVGAKEQLLGKILGVYFLIVIQFVMLFLFIFMYTIVTKTSNISIFLNNIGAINFTYSIVNIFISFLLLFIWTAEFSSYVTDTSQTIIAIIPPVIFATTSCIEGVFFSVNNDWFQALSTYGIIFFFAACFPPVGTFVVPSLLINKEMPLWEACIILLAQLVISIILFRSATKRYKYGLLNNKKSNVILEAMNNEFKKKG